MTNSRTLIRMACALILGASFACSPSDLVSNAQLPPNVPDPSTTKTPAGALSAYYGTLTLFNLAFAGRSNGGQTSAVAVSGLISDELQAKEIGGPAGVSDQFMLMDGRTLPEYSSPQLESTAGAQGSIQLYDDLEATRGQANEARGLIGDYGTANMKELSGHLYAIQGVAETMLAEMFCSGVPLSTVDYNGNYTLRPGSSTQDILTHAVALFDSALTLAPDSQRVVALASVGKGRALLGLNDYAGAANAVAAVPDGFQYLETYPGSDIATTSGSQQATQSFAVVNSVFGGWELIASDKEGLNGLDFRSSGDPRTSQTAVGTTDHGVTVYHPDKYDQSGGGSVVLADWEEARLIEAEAALKAGDLNTWLGKLNHLRESAISPALPDTTDPGTPDARVNLTFRERAFWLYLTAHRQGDLRRLIRQYGRSQGVVFPAGLYRGSKGSYGSDVNFPPPALERVANPQYTGCLGRGA